MVLKELKVEKDGWGSSWLKRFYGLDVNVSYIREIYTLNNHEKRGTLTASFKRLYSVIPQYFSIRIISPIKTRRNEGMWVEADVALQGKLKSVVTVSAGISATMFC